MEEKEITKEKSLYERHSPEEGKINITTLTNEIEAKLKTLDICIKKHNAAIEQLNEAMSYVAKIMDDQDKNKIILPTEFEGSTKL